MTTGVAIPGGSEPLSIRNLLCGGDVHGNALGRWSMLALPELPACCLVICLSHSATGRFLLRMSGARTDGVAQTVGCAGRRNSGVSSAA